ncbi:hypothetical protein CC86DRAFT_403693 [Ophiobolus disseminans]|uniref:Uncharacterized protein n=1 Tax=Ophiobolus disseminans TaxID=1469910 RepID=A0A6A7A8B4_9PLEO|nr:hypothetical protein CC86DRAFT_403693 [Ophiobolus disseminans]
MEPWDFLATTTTIKPESLAGITETLNSWPRVIQPRVVHHAFAQEVGQTFYEEYEGLTVVDARKIDEILNTDFFKLDVRLNSCVLPALTVCIRLDGVKDTFFDPSRQLLPTLADPKDSHTVPSADLFDCFAPLLVDKQRLKRNFKPVIHLYNPRLFDGCMSWVGGVDEAAIRDAIELFIPMLQTCKPVVAALRKRCQADVKIVIGFGDATDLVVQEAQMDYDVEE